MNHLTRIVAALLAGAMAFTFASCDDDDDDDGVTELSEWELCYTDTSGYYWEWDIEFNSDGTFEIDLDVEYGRNDVFDSVFARGTYSGNATTTSGEITLSITSIVSDYSSYTQGSLPATVSTVLSAVSLTGAATIGSGTLTLKIDGITVGSSVGSTSFAKTDGVARSEISEWEYKPTVSGYTVEYTLEFFSDDTFYIELDVETTAGSDVFDDIIFAYGTISSGSASSTSSSSASLTLTVTRIASDYSSIVGGTYSGVTTTLAEPTDTITLSASITAGATTTADTLTLSSDALGISSWSFSRDF